MVVGKRYEDDKKLSNLDLEREDECGICLEPCTKMVLPNCCHAMCIHCYHDWYERPSLHSHFDLLFVSVSDNKELGAGTIFPLCAITGTQGQNPAHFAGEV